MVEVASLVLARRRQKNFERALDFLHNLPQTRAILFWGEEVKMVPYIHIFYTARRRREKLWFFFWGQNGAIYICIFTQPAAGETIRGFGGSKCYHMYTFWGIFLVKILPYIYIHISGIYFFPKKRTKKKYPPPPPVSRCPPRKKNATYREGGG